MAKKAVKRKGARKLAPKKGIKTKGSPLAAATRKARKYAREITRLELENDSLREQNADLSAQLDEALLNQSTGEGDGLDDPSEALDLNDE